MTAAALARRLAELEARRSQPQPGVLPAWLRWAAHEEVDELEEMYRAIEEGEREVTEVDRLRCIEIEARATGCWRAGGNNAACRLLPLPPLTTYAGPEIGRFPNFGDPPILLQSGGRDGQGRAPSHPGQPRTSARQGRQGAGRQHWLPALPQDRRQGHFAIDQAKAEQDAGPAG